MRRRLLFQVRASWQMWPVLVLTGCAALSGLDDLNEATPGAATTANDGGGNGTFDSGTSFAGGDGGNVLPDGNNPQGDSFVPATDGGEGGGPLPDGQPPPDVIVPPTGFCKSLTSVPTLCTDFDDGVFPGPWEVHANGGASATSSTASSRSAPRSVFFDEPAAPTHAYLAKTFAPAATELVVGFSMRLVQLNAGATDFELMAIRFGVGASAYELQLERKLGNLSVEEEVPGAANEVDTNTGIPWALDTWRRVEVKIAMGNGASTLTVTAEGATPYTQAVSAFASKDQAPFVVIGFDNDVGNVKTYYDDIVVNVK